MVNQLFSLYIDPGTGSMLFTVLIGILSAAVYLVRTLIIKLKSGAGRKADKNRIPLVIYSDSKRYWNTFEPICDELEARGVDTVFMTSSPDDPALSKEYKHISIFMMCLCGSIPNLCIWILLAEITIRIINNHI